MSQSCAVMVSRGPSIQTALTMTSDEREYWEERAAIREYDGGQSREDAERGALEDLHRKRERDERR